MSTLCLIDIQHFAGDELSNSQVFHDQIHMSDVAIINNQATSRGAAVLQRCTSALLLGDGRALFGAPKETLTPDNLVDHRYLSQSQAAWIEDMYSQSKADDV